MTYANPHSVLAVGIVFLVLGVFTVTLRLSIRNKAKSGIGIEDWLCLTALVCGSQRTPTFPTYTIG